MALSGGLGRTGRPGGEERKNFVSTGISYEDGKRVYWKCIRCDLAYEAYKNRVEGRARNEEDPDPSDRVPEPELIKPRVEAYRSHLKRCIHHQKDAGFDPLAFARPGNARVTANHAAMPAKKKQRRIDDFFSKHEEQQMFERELLLTQASLALPASFVDNRQFRKFFSLMDTPYTLPSGKTLGGRILKKYAGEFEKAGSAKLREQQKLPGVRLNALSDDYQNVARKHLLGWILGAFGYYGEYDLIQVGDRHDGMQIAKQLEELLNKAERDGWIIGAVVTDDAGQCARARRILALRWPKLVFLRCFAHDVNNLVKAVLKTTFKKVTQQAGDAVNALHASSGKWLVRAQAAMSAVYEENQPNSFLTLCDTRWNSMHECFASLLRVKTAMEDFAHHYRNDTTFPDALKVFSDQKFWKDLAAAERVTFPLVEVSLRLQRDDNTMADVVRSFYKMYKGFACNQYEFELLPCLEQRWARCEQPLLLLGLAFHPKYVAFYRSLMIDDTDNCTRKTAPLISWLFFIESGLYYYGRLVQKPVETLYEELDLWIRGKSGYVATASSFSSDLVPSFWGAIQRERPKSKLPELALTILSVAVNTATCERYFSELGLIQTSKRSRLKVDKLRQMAAARRYEREQNGDDANKVRAQLKKPTNPAELRKRSDPDSLDDISDSSAAGNGPTNQPNEISSDGNVDEVVDAATIINHWLAVLGDSDVGTSNATETAPELSQLDELYSDEEGTLDAIASGNVHIPDRSAPADYDYDSDDDLIPEPDRSISLPSENDANYPQESKLRGLRGRKATLGEIFGGSRQEMGELLFSP